MSYGRIHRAFFDSSIIETDLPTRFVFVAMIVLSDQHGRIDITRLALARRTNVSPEDVDRAIATLSEPDPLSRTSDYDGARIVPIDPARSWGWVVINKGQYRQGSADHDEIRVAARERKRKQRERDKLQSNPSLAVDSFASGTSSKELHTPSVTVTPASRAVTRGHAVSREKCDALFDRCWSLVPRKEGKIDARKCFDKDLRGLSDAEDVEAAFSDYGARLERAIRCYAARVTTREPDKVMHGSRLFRNFRDYENIEATHRTPGAKAALPFGRDE